MDLTHGNADYWLTGYVLPVCTGFRLHKKNAANVYDVRHWLHFSYVNGTRDVFYCLAVNMLELKDLTELLEMADRRLPDRPLAATTIRKEN